MVCVVQPDPHELPGACDRGTDPGAVGDGGQVGKSQLEPIEQDAVGEQRPVHVVDECRGVAQHSRVVEDGRPFRAFRTDAKQPHRQASPPAAMPVGK